jgi:hypothetical protein
MKIVKIGDEVFLEYSTPKETLKLVAQVIGVAVFGIVMFYTLWILLGFLE